MISNSPEMDYLMTKGTELNSETALESSLNVTFGLTVGYSK